MLKKTGFEWGYFSLPFTKPKNGYARLKKREEIL